MGCNHVGTIHNDLCILRSFRISLVLDEMHQMRVSDDIVGFHPALICTFQDNTSATAVALKSRRKIHIRILARGVPLVIRNSSKEFNRMMMYGSM